MTKWHAFFFFQGYGFRKLKSRKELEKITAGLQIHYKNPLVCMTQQMSKKYIKTVDAEELYENWLQGNSFFCSSKYNIRKVQIHNSLVFFFRSRKFFQTG